MLIESVFAVGVGALIGTVAYARRRRGNAAEVEREQTMDWPEYEADRRAHGEQMRVALMVSDARFILHHQYAGRSASRRAMVKKGLPERRWKYAVLLLRTLHIYDKAGYVPVVNERFAEQRLERYRRIHAARITHSPASYVSPR